MELRKIQVTGGSTHVISLPKKWVDRNGLTRSETLAIHEEPDGSLLIVPHSDARPRQRRVDVSVRDPVRENDLVRGLVGAYLAGADIIHLQAAGRMDPRVRDIVRSTIRDLVGVEILEETSSSMTLQDLVGVSEMDLRKTVTRMHRIAGLMFDEALEAMSSNDRVLARSVTQRDDELDRLEWHVSKQMHALLEQPRLAARLQIRPAEALNLTLVARALERVGDHASKMCKNLPDDAVPTELAADVLQQAELVKKLWEEAFAALKRDDFGQGSSAVDLGKQAAAWKTAFSQKLQHLPGELAEPLTIIADSVDRVRGYAIDIAEIAMNQTFQRQAQA